MLKNGIKRGGTAAAALSIIFAAVCIVYTLLPSSTARAASKDILMQGGDTQRTVYTEVTPGETVCINTADALQLQILPGIGPTLAERIVDYRQDNGDFAQIEDIMEVKGIGPGRFETICELISV